MRIIEREFQVDPTHPFRRFFGSSKPKVAKPPPPAAPTPTVRQIDEDVKQRDRDRRRQRIVAAGRRGTILTQGQPLGQTATLLGRTTS